VIAVVGEALIDAHYEVDLLRPFPGGGPFNTAIALARLGAPACFVGAISRDRFGRLLDDALRSAGVETGTVVRVDAPTPIAIVDLSSAEPAYSFYLAGTAVEAFGSQGSLDLPAEAVELHVGTLALAIDPPGALIAELAEREARTRGLVLDPNIRPAVIRDHAAYLRRFERLAGIADLVKLSVSDVAWLYPDLSDSDAAAHLLETGAGCVAVTLGSAGAQAWTEAVTVTAAAPRVAVADTVGAGDAFGAGLLAWLWRAERSARSLRALDAPELEEALTYASAVAAAQCTRPSAWGPTQADVERLLNGSAAGV
jgi:fructokinase